MTAENRQPGLDAHEFILKNIDSVPHLEALVLFWNSKPNAWTSEQLASRLYISLDAVNNLLHDLVRLQLITSSQASPMQYSYFSRSKEQDEMMLLVDNAYRRDLVRISTMIHSKASSSIREFARAFRFKRGQD